MDQNAENTTHKRVRGVQSYREAFPNARADHPDIDAKAIARIVSALKSGATQHDTAKRFKIGIKRVRTIAREHGLLREGK